MQSVLVVMTELVESSLSIGFTGGVVPFNPGSLRHCKQATQEASTLLFTHPRLAGELTAPEVRVREIRRSDANAKLQFLQA